MDFLTESDVLRFWSKVSVGPDNDCWLWTAKASSAAGYGVLKVREHGNVVASRISCYLRHGAPPDGKPFAIHSCDTPACCNPYHLRWGDAFDNMADAIERGRKTPPPKAIPGRKTSSVGMRKPNTSLTDDLAREVWRLHLEGAPVSRISRELDIGHHVVSDLCRGRSFRHLPDAPSLESLRAGGVRRGFNQFNSSSRSRDVSYQTKVQSSEIPAILKRLELGETLESVGKSYGVGKAAIWKIRKQSAV